MLMLLLKIWVFLFSLFFNFLAYPKDVLHILSAQQVFLSLQGVTIFMSLYFQFFFI